MRLTFTNRAELAEFEWEHSGAYVNRVAVDREAVLKLTARSNLHGLVRVALYSGALLLGACGVVTLAHVNLWLALPVLYAYWFVYGFMVGIAHELQHQIVFAKSWAPLSEILYFVVQALLWNSPRYARLSHQLHHRYTMVRGLDPETDWPAVITSSWLRRYLRGIILNILVVGVVRSLPETILLQVRRSLGVRDRMMRDHCSAADIRAIRIESAGILFFHLAVVAGALVFRRWEPILFVIVATQVGGAMEMLWHQTEHICRAYSVNDQRLATRSIKVSPLIRLLYGGLDDHVEHHLFPSVPSRNLPKLRQLLKTELAEPRSMTGCWREMFAVAREKDERPASEYVPISPLSGASKA